jgi:hypothetical protein
MRKILLLTILAVAASPAWAKDFRVQDACKPSSPSQPSPCQSSFDSMAEDAVATIDYKAMGPAEATGVVGFGIGVVAAYIPIDIDQSWKDVTGTEFSGLGILGLQVTKGLPLNIDVGAIYSIIPDTNVQLFGGEIRYAILPGSTVSPALGVRASYVTVTGVDDLDLESKAVDVELSKGFAIITPYVGAGYVWGVAEADPQYGLEDAEVNKTKAYIGARISFGLFEITPEVGQIGDNTTYNMRGGFSFSL